MAKGKNVFYGWFVLVGAVVIVSTAYSMRYSFSVFYKAILDEYGWSRAETAAAFSLNMLVYGLISPFVGNFTDRFGPKRVLLAGAALLGLGLLGMSRMDSIWLFFGLFGVVMAIGINSLGYAVHNSYLPNWFVGRRGLAFGILLTSSGLGNVIASQYPHLIIWFGWRTAYALMALITVAVTLPLVLLVIRGKPGEMGLLPDGADSIPGKASAKRRNSIVVDKEWAAKDWTVSMVARTPRFWLLFLSQMFSGVALNTNTAHQVIHLQDSGFDPVSAASVLGLVGVVTMAGSLISSISDRFGREVTFTIGGAGTVIAIFALMQATAAQAWLLYTYAIFWGIFFGLGSPALISGLADLFGGSHFGAINGLFMVGWGVGGAIGPWFGGFIYDATGSYDLAFLSTMTSMVIACILFWLAAPRKIRLVSGKANK